MLKTFIFSSLLLLLFTAFTCCKRAGKNDIDATIYVKEYKTGIPITNLKETLNKWLLSIIDCSTYMGKN